MAACVPTGINAGVSTTPCGVVNQPSRAEPSGDAVRKANGVAVRLPDTSFSGRLLLHRGPADQERRCDARSVYRS